MSLSKFIPIRTLVTFIHKSFAILLLYITLILPKAYAQEYKVESFEIAPKDLSARTEGRVDGNGRKCAVIKVYVKDAITDTDGPVIGEIRDRGMEKWIYVSHDAKQVGLLFKEHMPLQVIFADYDFPTVTGQMTYILKLTESINDGDNSGETELSNQTFSHNPIIINSETYDNPINNQGDNIHKSDFSELGAAFMEVTVETRKHLGISSGVQVTDLRNGPLKNAGVKEGFIITKVNNNPVDSFDNIEYIYNSVMRDVSPDKVLILAGIYPTGKKGYYAINLSDNLFAPAPEKTTLNGIKQKLEVELGKLAKIEKVSSKNGTESLKIIIGCSEIFLTGKSQMSNKAKDNLNYIIESLKEHSRLKVNICVYTDDTGSYKVNKKISDERSNSIASYFIEQGVSPNNILSEGKPMRDYIADNSTSEGRAANRRVEIILTESK